MKVSLFTNDKSTFWDEIILLVIMGFFIAIGVLLVYFRPGFGIVKESNSVVFGILMIVAGGGNVPGLVYRLFNNDK
ncbi:MAG: hypothetical protein K2N51_06240 [Lachnospiraceae bacterium]|nr:hypothetical protein [Lachnospiraceae bacterium]